MEDDEIERMLVDIFKHWFQKENLYELLSSENNSESVIKRQDIFNETKNIVKKYI